MKFRLVAGLGESLEVDESSSHLVVSLDWRVWNGLTAFCTKAFYSCRSSARAGEMEMEGEGHVWVMALALGAGPGRDALWAVFSCPSKVYSAHGSQRDFFFKRGSCYLHALSLPVTFPHPQHGTQTLHSVLDGRCARASRSAASGLTLHRPVSGSWTDFPTSLCLIPIVENLIVVPPSEDGYGCQRIHRDRDIEQCLTLTPTLSCSSLSGILGRD